MYTQAPLSRQARILPSRVEALTYYVVMVPPAVRRQRAVRNAGPAAVLRKPDAHRRPHTRHRREEAQEDHHEAQAPRTFCTRCDRRAARASSTRPAAVLPAPVDLLPAPNFGQCAHHEASLHRQRNIAIIIIKSPRIKRDRRANKTSIRWTRIPSSLLASIATTSRQHVGHGPRARVWGEIAPVYLQLQNDRLDRPRNGYTAQFVTESPSVRVRALSRTLGEPPGNDR